MYTKVLIAEDFQGDNKSIVDTLSEVLKIPTIQEEYYCDQAYNRLQTALQHKDPFQLLITDLSFKEGRLDRKLSSGIELIKASRKLYPGLQVIVNSIEDNPVKINQLFNDLKIDGYVSKGRQSLNELVEAVKNAFENKKYVSPQIHLNTSNNVFELEEIDLIVLNELAEGFSKKEIREKLVRENRKPNSESSLDKRVSRLFVAFEVKNTTELVAKLIRKGII